MGTNYFDKETPELVLRSLFKKYDPDGDGTLSKDQLKTILVDDLCLPSENAETVLYLGDDDGHLETFTFKEFLKFIKSGEASLTLVVDQARYHKIHDAIDMFKQYDTDHSGTLSAAELKAMLEALGHPDYDALSAFHHFDADKNGLVTFPEFLHWLNWV